MVSLFCFFVFFFFFSSSSAALNGRHDLLQALAVVLRS
jgi:hypothetical protein